MPSRGGRAVRLGLSWVQSRVGRWVDGWVGSCHHKEMVAVGDSEVCDAFGGSSNTKGYVSWDLPPWDSWCQAHAIQIKAHCCHHEMRQEA